MAEEEQRRGSPARAGWKGAVYQMPSAGLGSRYPSIGRHLLYTVLTIGAAVLLGLLFMG